MDPLSLAASLIAVLGAAQAGCKALEKVYNTRKAPSEVADLLGELSRFKALLEEINELLNPQRGLQGGKHLQDLVQHGGDIIGEINSLIDQTWPRIRLLKLSKASRQRVTVLKDGEKLRSLKDALRTSRLDLTAALSLLTASSSIQLVGHVAATAKLHHDNTVALSTLLQKVTFIEESARQLQEASAELVRPMIDYESTISGPDPADSAHEALPPESVALTLNQDSICDGPRGAPDHASEQSSPMTHETPRCVDWCSCRCHTQSVSEFPWILKAFLGHLFIERASNGSECNEHGCRRSKISSMKLTYHGPLLLMRRYIKFAMHHSPLNGLNLLIRMPRVMDWQHEFFKHAVVGDVQAIQSLFSEGKASPYDVNPRGSNALMYAAAHGNPELGQFLLRNGADPELLDSNGRRPVDLFAERAFSGQYDSHGYHLVKKMYEGTNFVESRRFTPLHKIVLGLVDRDLGKELTMSISAINDCDAQGRTALCWATVRDDRSSVETLLAFGADPNIPDYIGCTCLHFVRSPEVCRALLEKQADIRSVNRMYSRTPLHSFCKRGGTLEMIDQLVQAGLEVDVRDSDGETPLLNAIFRGYTAAAEKLINLGADLDARNTSSQESSIHFAVEFDRYDILPLLLRRGVDYTARNIRGRTIAHMAARVASARTIEILASFDLAGLDLSLKDTDGNTAADYLSNRKLVSDSDMDVRKAFAQLQQACHSGNPFHGPHLHEIYDLEGQELRGRKERFRLPGAFPEPARQEDREKEKVWRDAVASFRCDYRSPCCFVFDAPRGMCSGVISYQSHGQVS